MFLSRHSRKACITAHGTCAVPKYRAQCRDTSVVDPEAGHAGGANAKRIGDYIITSLAGQISRSGICCAQLVHLHLLEFPLAPGWT